MHSKNSIKLILAAQLISAICNLIYANEHTQVLLSCRLNSQLQNIVLERLCAESVSVECWPSLDNNNTRTLFASTSTKVKLATVNIFCAPASLDKAIIGDYHQIYVSNYRKRRSRKTTNFDWKRYQSYDDIQAYLRTVVATHPRIASLRSIGRSYENRSLIAIKIGRGSNVSKNEIFIDAGIHAREWAAPHTALTIIHKLTSEYASSSDVRSLVDGLTWWVLPVANPDGYVFSQGFDPDAYPDLGWRERRDMRKRRMWRKSRRELTETCEFHPDFCCGVGVDLNRNFDIHWEKQLMTGKKCEETYAGPRAFSEPETRALRDFILSRLPMMQSYISLHMYGQLWAYPWGHAKNTFPDNVDELRRVAEAAVAAIRRATGRTYVVGSSADILYATSGDSVDWAKSVGVRFPYLVELRPDFGSRTDVGNQSGGFFLPPSQLGDLGTELWAGMRALATELIILDSPELTNRTSGEADKIMCMRYVPHEYVCGSEDEL